MADLEVQNRKLRKALRDLVECVEERHADDRYKAVWAFYLARGGTYSGPRFEKELLAAHDALMEEA